MKLILVSVFIVVSLAVADGPVGPVIGYDKINAVSAKDARARAEMAEKLRRQEQVASANNRPFMLSEWRVIGGKTNQVNKEDFVAFNGKVISSNSRGILISTGFDVYTKAIFVENYPQVVVDGTFVSGYAKDAGVYRYTAVSGAAATVQKLDYGIPVEAPGPSESEIAMEQWRKQQIASARESESAATQARVLAYQLEQANKGYPSFQIEIAKRYLKGDGVEVNTNLAIHWLQAACTNGESQASNLLNKISR